MKKDISSREDIHFIITEFYKKLISDSEMLPFFEKIVQQNHLDFNKKVRFKKEHFTKWLGYLTTTINASFEGQVAQNMKDRANSIAMVMQVKFKLYD